MGDPFMWISFSFVNIHKKRRVDASPTLQNAAVLMFSIEISIPAKASLALQIFCAQPLLL